MIRWKLFLTTSWSSEWRKKGLKPLRGFFGTFIAHGKKIVVLLRRISDFPDKRSFPVLFLCLLKAAMRKFISLSQHCVKQSILSLPWNMEIHDYFVFAEFVSIGDPKTSILSNKLRFVFKFSTFWYSKRAREQCFVLWWKSMEKSHVHQTSLWSEPLEHFSSTWTMFSIAVRLVGNENFDYVGFCKPKKCSTQKSINHLNVFFQDLFHEFSEFIASSCFF